MLLGMLIFKYRITTNLNSEEFRPGLVDIQFNQKQNIGNRKKFQVYRAIDVTLVKHKKLSESLVYSHFIQ